MASWWKVLLLTWGCLEVVTAIRWRADGEGVDYSVRGPRGNLLKIKGFTRRINSKNSKKKSRRLKIKKTCQQQVTTPPCMTTKKQEVPRTQGPCYINIGAMPLYEPLLLRPCGTHDITGFYLPESGDDTVVIPPGGKVLLACPGVDDLPNHLRATHTSELEVTCVRNSEFMLSDGAILNFTSLSCIRYPVHTARNTGRPCGRPIPNASIIEIGFQLSDPQNFYKLAEVCFNTATLDPYYSSILQVPQISERNSTRTSHLQFLPDQFYGNHDLADLYTRVRQSETIGKQVGSQALGEFYVKPANEKCNLFYLYPGHLVPPKDFIFESHRRAMSYYINSAPQWQLLRTNNWRRLEQDVRTFVSSYGLHLAVYTGTHGTTSLTSLSGDQSAIALEVPSPDRKMRVPHLFWKVLVDPDSNKGVAFVSVNNPYYLDSCDCKFKLCEDVCDKISWIHWDRDNNTAGLSYCCNVNDLSRYVYEIPQLYITGLLT